jgi:regulation of enolase protein 1 (concanavalin A-like superfamily)
MRRCSVFLIAGLCSAMLAAPAPKGNVPLRDDFNGKFSLNWKVIRPDATHVSLNKTVGSLVITTQRGSIHGKEKVDAFGEGVQAKNIHLIDIPFGNDVDWVATTCVTDFHPTNAYQQAGLIVYTDDDHYLKWSYEFNWATGQGQRFILVSETDGEPTHVVPKETNTGLKKVYLRLTKQGKKYLFDWSENGEKWTKDNSVEWGDGSPKRVGLIAKNGGNKEAAAMDVTFDFFELRQLPSEKK